MKCLYCTREINDLQLSALLFRRPLLCQSCRKALQLQHLKTKLEDFELESLYKYDSLFKTLLLQYKECYDEALSPVFLNDWIDYLRFKYHGYQLLYPPISQKKLQERGFDHLFLIFKELKLPIAEGLMMKEERIQEGLDQVQRSLMKDNFCYSGKAIEKLLIVDDVVTTGATIMGIRKAVGSRAKVIKALALAKV